jgi:pimeloyl-ACP methyl ester carboxylesterase
MLTALAATLVAAAAAGSVGQRWAEARDRKAFPAPGRLVEVDGVTLHAVVSGTGPVVLIDSGLGGSSAEWSEVASLLEESFTVVRYDRPGFGWSPAHAGDRSPRAVADRFPALISALGLSGPCVLVGHSMGGLHVRLAASLHPEFVCGLVLVDPSHEDMLDGPVPAAARVVETILRTTAALSPLGIARPVGRLYGRMVASQARRSVSDDIQAMAHRATLLTLCTVSGIRAVTAELVDVPAALKQVRELTAEHPVPPVPLTVISAAAPPRNRAEEEAQATMRELHSRHAALSPRGGQVLAEGSGHLVMLDEPALIAGCVRETFGVEARR